MMTNIPRSFRLKRKEITSCSFRGKSVNLENLIKKTINTFLYFPPVVVMEEISSIEWSTWEASPANRESSILLIIHTHWIYRNTLVIFLLKLQNLLFFIEEFHIFSQ